MKSWKGFVSGFVVASLLSLGVVSFAAINDDYIDLQRTLVNFNQVKVFINLIKVESDIISYNGTTYIPLRYVSEKLGHKVNWYENSKTAVIQNTDDINWKDTSNQYITPVPSEPEIIESRIDGEFEGWSYEKIFKLQNGQIWQQTSFNISYHYYFSPSVLIYKSGTTYKMKIDGMDEDISVKQLK